METSGLPSQREAVPQAGAALLRSDDMIAEIQAIESAAREALRARGVRQDQSNITKIRYSHDAMIDILIANPWVSQGELAKHFGYSEPWVSKVMSTDMFKAKLAARRAEIVDPVLSATMQERVSALMVRSLDVLQEKMSNPIVSQIPDNLALRAAEFGAKALGMGGNAPPVAPPPPVDHLSRLAERLIALQAGHRDPVPVYLRSTSNAEITDVESRDRSSQEERLGNPTGPNGQARDGDSSV